MAAKVAKHDRRSRLRVAIVVSIAIAVMRAGFTLAWGGAVSRAVRDGLVHGSAWLTVLVIFAVLTTEPAAHRQTDE